MQLKCHVETLYREYHCGRSDRSVCVAIMAALSLPKSDSTARCLSRRVDTSKCARVTACTTSSRQPGAVPRTGARRDCLPVVSQALGPTTPPRPAARATAFRPRTTRSWRRADVWRRTGPKRDSMAGSAPCLGAVPCRVASLLCMAIPVAALLPPALASHRGARGAVPKAVPAVPIWPRLRLATARH